MSDGLALGELLEAAQRAETERDDASLMALAHVAADHGLQALAVRSALLGRQRGYAAAPSDGELERLLRFEQLEPLLDLSIEHQNVAALRRIVIVFGGHPDLHPHGIAAADAIAAMGLVPPAQPKRRSEPDEDGLWTALLAGDRSLFGWGLRRFGAPFADRVMRLAGHGVAALRPLAEVLPDWVEISAGVSAAIPYMRFAFEHGLGEPGARRMALMMGAAGVDREVALSVCRTDAERESLARWVLGRAGSEPMDPRWLRFLDADALQAFAEAEGRRWVAGEAPRLQAHRIADEPRLAEAFQPWFMAIGDYASVLGCVAARARVADRPQRIALSRTAAELLDHLGRPREALERASEALLLDATDEDSKDLVLTLGKSSPRLAGAAHEALLLAAQAADEPTTALDGLGLLSGAALVNAMATQVDQWGHQVLLKALDKQRVPPVSLTMALYRVLGGRGLLDKDRLVGFIRDRLGSVRDRAQAGELEALLALVDQLEDDPRALRLRVPLLIELGRGGEALEAMSAANIPENGQWSVLRARALWLDDQRDEASTLLRRAAEQGSRSAATLLESLEASPE